MKTESASVKNKVVSESRKIRKPLMEKKRRARINDSLDTLKQILLESKTSLKETSGEESKKSGQRTAKLEKADILEMTVRYVQHLRKKLHQNNSKSSSSDNIEMKKNITITSADSSSDSNKNQIVRMGVTLIPTKLNSGEIVFVMPSSLNVAKEGQFKITENVWRPW